MWKYVKGGWKCGNSYVKLTYDYGWMMKDNMDEYGKINVIYVDKLMVLEWEEVMIMWWLIMMWISNGWNCILMNLMGKEGNVVWHKWCKSCKHRFYM